MFVLRSICFEKIFVFWGLKRGVGDLRGVFILSEEGLRFNEECVKELGIWGYKVCSLGCVCVREKKRVF